MPRRTRNSQDADYANTEPSPGESASFMENVLGPSSLPMQQQRQEFVNEVVQAVLAATSAQGAINANPVNVSQPVASEAPANQGMSESTVLPGFVNTFSLPSCSSNTDVVATALPHSSSLSASLSYPGAPSDTTRLPTSGSSSSTQVCQPFIVGPGYAPIPAKTVSHVVCQKFIDLSELLTPSTVDIEPEQQLFMDGRVVLMSRPKSNRKRIADILSWVEAFSIFMSITTTYCPERVKDLSCYKLTVIRLFRQFDGWAWLAYDEAFRKEAAITKQSNWSVINHQLYTIHTAGASVRSSSERNSQGREKREPRGSTNGNRTCISWNEGFCSSRYASCRFAHRCSSCSEPHRSIACTRVAKASNEQFPPTPTNGPPNTRQLQRR